MPDLGLQDLPLWACTLLACASAGSVWLGGTRLALNTDALAERLGWSRQLAGMLLLAGLTGLPELVTTLVAATGGEIDLAANNLFGGIALQTAILVAADALLARRPLTFLVPRPTLILQGLLLVMLLSVTLGLASLEWQPRWYRLGAWSAALLAAYVVSVALLRRYERRETWRPVDIPDELSSRDGPRGARSGRTSKQLIGGLAGSALVVVVCGTLVVLAAEQIASLTGLGSSFVGATLVAGSTSLPELSTTLGAVRLGAYEMAVANIFGSNAMMVALLPITDLAYGEGSVLAELDGSARMSAVLGIAVTTVYVIGLVERRDRSYLRLGPDSWIVLALYVAGLAALYTLR